MGFELRRSIDESIRAAASRSYCVSNAIEGAGAIAAIAAIGNCGNCGNAERATD